MLRIIVAFTICVASVATADSGLRVSGGVTGTYQTTTDRRVEPEFTASADLVLTYARNRGEWRLYIEGNSTPRPNGVSSLLPEANTDAGSALDENRQGRVQISELNYTHRFGESVRVSAGLVDVSGYFDQSRIASDESTQFLGVSFVQNPAIEFPDYALGLVYEQDLTAHTVWRAGLSGSHGLADNANLSYGQLVDVDDPGKGVFAVTSLAWRDPAWLTRAGLWIHTAPHDSLDGMRTGLSNGGVYWLGGWRQAPHGVNLRLGIANREVSRVARFAGLAYRLRQAPWVWGIGAARMFLSPDEPDPALDDTTQYETYLRYRFANGWFATGDVQHLVNSNFDRSGAVHDRRVTVYGLRLTRLVD